ncbi:tight junction protein ZO-1 isoform X1 [Lates japonicus]|uniref:Tight junction protein ZO-1 isoform X1 n=1 Tax=Lates japonicus TaxID=270547 RepID=A0AAD3M4G3_LATJO|nr:tight junction protein ZO-1 isoform X1 [Lates japonicus]
MWTFANIIREEAVLFLLDLPRGEVSWLILAQKKKDELNSYPAAAHLPQNTTRGDRADSEIPRIAKFQEEFMEEQGRPVSPAVQTKFPAYEGGAEEGQARSADITLTPWTGLNHAQWYPIGWCFSTQTPSRRQEHERTRPAPSPGRARKLSRSKALKLRKNKSPPLSPVDGAAEITWTSMTHQACPTCRRQAVSIPCTAPIAATPPTTRDTDTEGGAHTPPGAGPKH